MYDGNQVLRFEKYKACDLGGLNVELQDRKGTGNYDIERTKFNIEFVPLNNKTLMSKVYSTLNSNNINYGENKKNINLLNGAIVTSGQEFFKSLGMDFIPTERTYQTGDHKGEQIEKVNIVDKSDIPELVLDYFKESHEFLSNLVGKENVIYSGVHFDEDTPHLHFYFLPVVDLVQRKVFKTDSNGNILKKEITGKNGNIKLVPIQEKDENGKSIYQTEYGKFLNLDQFWKNLGGKSSYAKIQDQYNEYITSKGFNLYRGNVGANVEHQTKAEYKLKETKNELELLTKEIKYYEKIQESQLETNEDIINLNKEEVLSPSKDVFKRYKDKEVDNLINYTKEITKDNIVSKNIIKKQEIEIYKLTDQVNEFKSGKAYKKAQKTINEQKEEINHLNYKISSLYSTLEKCFKVINNAFKAIKNLISLPKEYLRIKHIQDEEDMMYFHEMCSDINKSKEKSRNDDDYEL